MADANYNLVQNVLGKLRTLEEQPVAVQREKLSLMKEIMESVDATPALLRPKANGGHPFRGKLVGEEQLTAKLHNQFQDYVKALQPDEKELVEEPKSDQDQLLAVQTQLEAIVDSLTEIVGSPNVSPRVAKVIGAYTIPAIEKIAKDDSETGSIADLIARLTSQQFEDYMAKDKEDTKLQEMAKSTFDDLYDWMERAERLGYKVVKVLGRKFHALNDSGEIKGEYFDNITTGGMGTLVLEGKGVIEPEQEVIEAAQVGPYKTIIGPNKDTVVEIKEETDGINLYLNDKLFGKKFTTVEEAKQFAQDLHKSLCESE